MLYADPASAQFHAFHRTLSKAAAKGELQYRLRYRRGQQATASELLVSGYGVELALKRTDYIVIDDREGQHESETGPAVAEANSHNVDLNDVEEVADLKPLSTSELSSLGLSAASFILESESPFNTLVRFTQDIPKYSASIATEEIDHRFLAEHQQNRKKAAPPGANLLWINGVQLTERQIEPFSLVDLIRRERTLLQGVRDLGFNGKQAVSLLGHEDVAAAKEKKEPQRLDWTDRQEEGKVIIWLNDLEKDKQYADYPRTVDSVRPPEPYNVTCL